MYGVAGGPGRAPCSKRGSLCHARQIAMYVCHVVMQVSLTEIGLAFGRDRTTVGHACRVTEERRDDGAYDEFVSAVERVAAGFIPGLDTRGKG
nr:helix-turn-helix domain-containing protein [Pararhizobium mangrovi]